MKKYHTGEVIIAVFILFMLWGGWKLSADVTYMDGYESYGFFRYQAYLSTYQDKKASTAVEPWCFSHVFYSPYLYIYGVSGYSKINVLPFVGHIDKVINSAYYDTVPKERTSGFENTLDYLQKQYDKNELSIKYHLYDMDEKDQEIFRQLKISGKGEEGRYFRQFYPKRWIKDGFNPNNIKQALDSL